jgi:hypothetical protein
MACQIMTREERLERLRKLRIEPQEEDEEVFDSQSACLEWIDKNTGDQWAESFLSREYHFGA